MRRQFGVTVAALAVLALASIAAAQQSAPPSQLPAPAPPATATAPSKNGSPASTNAEFLAAADEVLAQMSKILDLPVKQPLKKSLRSKAEIRAYLVQEEKEDRNDAQRYADEQSLKAFGLIPKDFPLDSFMIDLLTDQVAGLYDPKAKEFYIADWIPADQQREVMSHELTHALEDQYFDVDHWIKAARPNDDAESARQAVSEGSALAAMVDYTLRDDRTSVRDLPDLGTLMRAGALSQMNQDPELSNAPIYIRDSLIFPYLAGTTFSQQFLKAHTGWADLKLVFQDPPVSTQQIMHPELYLKGVKPKPAMLPTWNGLVPADWKLLEENVMGEFGLHEVLKQLLDPEQATALSPAWAGDRYAVFEDAKTKQTHLVFSLVLDNPDDANHFMDEYTEALEAKYKDHTAVYRQPNFLQFETSTGNVFLHCVAEKCLSVEGSTRAIYDAIERAMGWTPAPSPIKNDTAEAPALLPAHPVADRANLAILATQ